MEKKRKFTTSDVFTTNELVNMDKKTIDKIKNIRKDNEDDMEKLSYLDSARSKVFEKDWDQPKKKIKFAMPKPPLNTKKTTTTTFDEDNEKQKQNAMIQKERRKKRSLNYEDDGDDDEDEDEKRSIFSSSSEEEGDSDDEAKFGFSKFHLDENNDYFVDPVQANKQTRAKDYAEKQQDSWLLEYEEKKQQDKEKEMRGELHGGVDLHITRLTTATAKEKEKKEEEEEAANFLKDIERYSLSDLLQLAISYLNDGETVAAALRRLDPSSSSSSRNKNRNRNKFNNNNKSSVPPHIMSEEEKMKLKKLEKLTSIADVCMSKQYHDIYSNNREQLIHDIKKMKGLIDTPFE